MRNTLSDLNNYLFETLERLTDDELTEEQLQKEITRAAAVTKVSETVIHNGELILHTMKHLDEYGREGTRQEGTPDLLQITSGNKNGDKV